MYRFVFSFSNDDGEITYFFTLDGPSSLFSRDEYGRPTGYNCESDEHLEFLGKMESYGIHDFSISGYEEFIGYYTSEIVESNWDEVINKWRDFMSSKGFIVGEVVSMPYTSYQKEFFPC